MLQREETVLLHIEVKNGGGRGRRERQLQYFICLKFSIFKVNTLMLI